jgi:hypothetical protein
VALVEDIVVDCFRVEGGATHDWIVNHAGPAPEISLPLAPRTFTPEAWLAGGSGKVLGAPAPGSWSARWRVNDVTSRLHMPGAPDTEVFNLETWPLNNAAITPEFPPTQTLCVRRTNNTPFVAVWDAWKLEPTLASVEAGVNRPDAVMLRTVTGTWYLTFGAGAAEFSDGTRLESDAAFTAVNDGGGATIVGGTRAHIARGEQRGEVRLSARATFTLGRTEEGSRITVSGDIAHDTRGGADQPRPAPVVTHQIQGPWFSVAAATSDGS